eukprot:gnl/TRDRNA2_/TRDRNA2_200031_c0_seq1.p1 gnl/TRDRNA2_/TRDRNA2_200031_c0~~gnl/TRDRNA2_/TRDRNA2_200031_c0_seq1.p1  ORF type:complete len:435 (+),score=62.33 gnl/TRDRNA2_/TRDRNA2_200031_c0_seq1:60-1364(+)
MCSSMLAARQCIAEKEELLSRCSCRRTVLTCLFLLVTLELSVLSMPLTGCMVGQLSAVQWPGATARPPRHTDLDGTVVGKSSRLARAVVTSQMTFGPRLQQRSPASGRLLERHSHVPRLSSFSHPESLTSRKHTARYAEAAGARSDVHFSGATSDMSRLQAVIGKINSSRVAISPSSECLQKLQVLHSDPPVLLLHDFCSPQACEELIAAAKQSGIKRSSVGIGPAEDDASILGRIQNYIANALAMKRTSSTATLSADVAASCDVETLLRQINSDAKDILGLGAGHQWAEAGIWPFPEWLAFEPLQVSRYESGQQFMLHQDAWPLFQARRVELQRCATLIVYLNDVARGGATNFPYLKLKVQPKRGAALLFFPGFVNGQPDERTLHSAEPAEDEKWVVQLWTVCGVDEERSGSIWKKARELAIDLLQLNWLVKA